MMTLFSIYKSQVQKYKKISKALISKNQGFHYLEVLYLLFIF